VCPCFREDESLARRPRTPDPCVVRLLYHPLVSRLSRMDTATGNSNDSVEAALQRLDQALARGRSRKWCRTLWNRFVRLRDDHRCVICNSPNRVAAHHVVRKSFMPEAEFLTGNGATLCFACHRDHHGSSNGQPNLRSPMDAQGCEQIERLAALYAVLFDDACTRGLLRDDFYFLSDTVLAKFKMFQGLDPYLEFAGYRIEQARSIWNQSPYNLLSSIINAQDLGLDPMLFVRGLKAPARSALGQHLLRIEHVGGSR
jgi:hypothetical protein